MGPALLGTFRTGGAGRSRLPVGAAVLDVCAGMGALAGPAAECGYDVRAIDICPGTVRRAAQCLEPHPRCSAEVMDALDLRYGDDEFDAAFSVFGVAFFGPATSKVLAEMTRVVRPGGVVTRVSWAVAMGAPFCVPVARGIDRMDDPEAGRFMAPLTEYLERAELERALSDAGWGEVRSESVEVEFAVPGAEILLDELDPVLRILPQYRTAISKDGDRFRELLTEEVRLITETGAPPARATSPTPKCVPSERWPVASPASYPTGRHIAGPQNSHKDAP
ncbi:class I SAM-dependent methyltransferase [Streptomyces mirabilis]|uniref:class I SAM-dependent methyltransferase n=1 Tax=Streptomyces sp. NPDC005388 TaxID=3156717 RepID=UPI0033B8244A